MIARRRSSRRVVTDAAIQRGQRRTFAAAFATVVVACWSALASADLPPQSELLLFEDAPVTTASKRTQAMRDAPAAVNVITREQIRRLGFRTLAEALRSVPGFYVTSDRNYTFVGVRGLSRPGDYNDRILLLVNGHTYNDDVYQMAFVDQTFGIPMESIERIEVVQGAGSALYGGNAMFAIVNVITSTGESQPGVRALAETGSYGRKRGEISFGRLFDSGLDVFAVGSVLDLDGQENLFYREFDAPETHHGVAHDVDGERALNFHLNAGYGGFSLQGGTSTRRKHVPTGSFGTVFGDPSTKTTDSRHFGEVAYEADLPSRIRLDARAYYDGYHYHGTYVYGSPADRIKNEDFSDSDWYGSEVRLQRDLFEGNTAIAGLEYTYHPKAQEKNFDLHGDTFVDVSKTFGTLGLYAQDEWRLTDTLTAVAGLRYDRFYNGLDQVSPKAALLWSPVPATRVKVLYGHAYRPPNLYELYYYTSSSFVANPRLDPERIDSYELVIERELWKRSTLVVSAFHNEVGDLIDETVLTDPVGNSSHQFLNASDVHTSGGSIELRFAFPHEVTGRVHYTFQDTRGRGARSFTNSPRHLAYGSLLFPLVAGIEGGTELVLVGPRLTLGRARLSTVTLLNLTVIVPTPVDHLEFSTGLYNLLNQKYSDPGAIEHVQDRIAQDRFNFRLQVGYRW